MALPPSFHQVARRQSGSPEYLGTITATTTAQTNGTTAVPFKYVAGDTLAGEYILIQADAACYVLPGTTSAFAVTASNGVELSAKERIDFVMVTSEGYLSVKAVTGTVNLRVWRLR